MKKILSIFLVLVMLFTSVPIAYATEDGTAKAEAQTKSQLTAENGMANIINNLTNDVSEETNGFSIKNVVIEDQYAYVNINVAKECNLVVAIYDEDTFEMLGTGEKAVEASVYSQEKTEDIIEVEIDIDSMPDQFLVKAFLLDDNYNALCKEYVCRDYTTAYIKFMDTTPNDFPNSEIVAFEKNYDDFGVIADDVIVLKNAKYTYENSTYTFDDGNEQLSSLEVGDVIYIPLSDEIGDFILIKVATIEKNRTSIIITDDEDIAIGEAFQFVRIDADADFSDVSIDEENLGSAFEIIDEEENEGEDNEENGEASDEEGKVSAQSNERAEIVDDSKETECTTTLKVEYPKTESDDKEAWEKGLKISAELEYSLEASAKLYYDWRFGEDFYEFKTEINNTLTFAEISFSGEIKLNKENQKIEFPPISFGIFDLSITIYPVLSAKAKITLSNVGVNIYNCVFLNDSNGYSKINETKWLDMDDPECGNETITIKIGLGADVAFGVMKVFSADVSLNFETYAKFEFVPLDMLTDKHHDCIFCLTGSLDIVIKGTLSLNLKIVSDKLSWKWEAIKVEGDWPKGDCYLSINSNGVSFGFGTCKNISYAVTVTVKDENNEPIEGATVSTTTGFCDDDNDGNFDERSTKTDKNGQAPFYFKKGKHTITAENDGVKVKSDEFKIISNAKNVTIKLAKSTIDDGSTDAIASGSCGDNLTWTLDKTTGKLIISGTGPMEDYAYFGYDSVVASPFIYNDYIKTVVIEQGVTSIGDYAFWGCMSLKSITIPDSVASIGWNAFCDTAYYYDSSNWEDNVLYIGNHLIEAKTSISGNYTIKSGTKCIADKAFGYCESLTSITIPNSVTSIDAHAFDNCTSLTYIDVSLNNETYSSKVGVLFNKAQTILIRYPRGKSSAEYIIPNGVTSIGDNAFYDCESLTSITLPDSVTSIGDEAFSGCSGLTSVAIGNSVRSIGDYAFSGCTSLTSITILDSVISIGYNAFVDTAYYNDSSNWEDDVLYIGNHLIEAKTSISGKYTIKSGTKCIADEAFSRCTSLKSITIPDSVTSIGEFAFEDCTSLTSTDSVSLFVSAKVKIPDSVTYIGYGAFNGCSSLTNIDVSSNNETYSSKGGVLFNNEQTILIKYPEGKSTAKYTIPSSVTSIDDSAFRGCTSLTSITIPDSVESIGDRAFWYCESLESITIPDSVTKA